MSVCVCVRVVECNSHNSATKLLSDLLSCLARDLVQIEQTNCNLKRKWKYTSNRNTTTLTNNFEFSLFELA